MILTQNGAQEVLYKDEPWRLPTCATFGQQGTCLLLLRKKDRSSAQYSAVPTPESIQQITLFKKQFPNYRDYVMDGVIQDDTLLFKVTEFRPLVEFTWQRSKSTLKISGKELTVEHEEGTLLIHMRPALLVTPAGVVITPSNRTEMGDVQELITALKSQLDTTPYVERFDCMGVKFPKATKGLYAGVIETIEKQKFTDKTALNFTL